MNLPRPGAIAWADGRAVPLAEARVAIEDPAVQAGLGLFETIALRGGRPLELGEHLDRLVDAAVQLEIPLPDRPRLERVAREAAAAERSPYGWLKIVATRGARWFVYAGDVPAEDVGRPVSAVLLPWRRNPADPLVGLKTLNYASNLIGLERARRRGADEGLWLNTQGMLAEGSSSNLFLIRRGRLYTAGTREGILPGIVRGIVLTVVRSVGLVVHEGRVRLRKLETAGEAFLTSSVRAVRPLVEYNGRPIGSGRPGPITRRIAEEVERRRLAAL